MRRLFFFFLTLIFVGLCGCSYDVTEEEDLDKDGVPDSKDKCPDDPYQITEDVCRCGEHVVYFNNITGVVYSQSEYMSEHGTADKVFYCFSNKREDSDGDGIPDDDERFNNQGCPSNSIKYLKGLCGCDKPDPKEYDPEDFNEERDCSATYDPTLDTDNDGTPDLQDGCPRNRCKTKSGGCGCDKPDTPLCLEVYVNRNECTTAKP